MYGGPLLLGVLSIAGLLTALLSEGAGRYFSWIARWRARRHYRVVFRAAQARVSRSRYAGRISFSVAASRRLRFPASAMASSSAPASSQVPEKPMPTSWPPNTGFSPFAGVCS